MEGGFPAWPFSAGFMVGLSLSGVGLGKGEATTKYMNNKMQVLAISYIFRYFLARVFGGLASSCSRKLIVLKYFL